MDITHIRYFGDDDNLLFASTLGSGRAIVMLHGGGPDRQSIIPFAALLKDKYRVIFPDIRGYGESHCFEEAKHTWGQYANDVLSLIDFLSLDRIVISGMGLGASIAERFVILYPERVSALILISPETLDKEGEGSSNEEIEMLERCSQDARQDGLIEAWKPFLPHLAPLINVMVQEAIPRTNAESFAAAMAIVHSRRLESWKQLSKIIAPTLVIPGSDVRHDSSIGSQYLDLIPNCYLGNPIDWQQIQTVDQFAELVAPQILNFLKLLN
ncbi:alpha/beta hydrolase [Pedobacter sp. P351]|uniref:alpha/beta fold hydrolase n=1 Tax=Pedobacter superstes TaxID=3133441 RepID=UPI0030B40AEE